MKLSSRELAHVLAALRYCQDHAAPLGDMEHFDAEQFSPLSHDEVNGLCESLNCGSSDAPALPVAIKSPCLMLTFPIPENLREAKLAVHAGDLASAWHHFLEQVMRPMVKWAPEGEEPEVTKRTQEIFDKAWETVRESGVADLISG